MTYTSEFQKFVANSAQSHGQKVQTTTASIGPTDI